MKHATRILVTTTVLAAVPAFALAGARTEKLRGITVTVEADGQKDNGGETLHTFKLTTESSHRKDDKMVSGVIHLMSDEGDDLSDCTFHIHVSAAKKETTEVICLEKREWTQFTLELTAVEAPSGD